MQYDAAREAGASTKLAREFRRAKAAGETQRVFEIKMALNAHLLPVSEIVKRFNIE